ncbi:MAG: hypothetical protein ACRC3B_23170 [Bacteroidia bacterium]
MKKSILILLPILVILFAFGKKKEDPEKAEIQNVLNTFMDCIIKKDSVRFYNLFHKDPVVWVGVSKPKTYQDDLKKNSADKGYFSSNYKQFCRSICDKNAYEEKFCNIEITNDDGIASVMFDYSFWENQKKMNWGKESWALVKVNGQWKITSVIFSLEMENVAAEPNRK